MEEMLKLFSINYDVLNILECKNKIVRYKNYVIGRFTIVIIRNNAEKEFKKDLEEIAEYYKSKNKQLLMVREGEVISFSRLFNIFKYLSSYNNSN